MARLCSLQHSEYGDFAVGRASMEDFTEARANSIARSAQDKFTKGAQVGTLGKILTPTPEPGSFRRQIPFISVRNSQFVPFAPLDELSQELVVFARSALLDVVKARYMHSIHTGKIGSSVMAAKILLYSVDVAQDHVHESLQDWAMVAGSLTPSNGFIARLRRMDEIVYRVCGRHAALVPFLDAVNERNALYVLINFIDAHEYALDKLQFILGVYDGTAEEGGAGGVGSGVGSGEGSSGKGNGGDGARSRLNSSRTTSTDVARFSQVEMHKVILETVDHVSQAHHIAAFLNYDDEFSLFASSAEQSAAFVDIDQSRAPETSIHPPRRARYSHQAGRDSAAHGRGRSVTLVILFTTLPPLTFFTQFDRNPLDISGAHSVQEPDGRK